MIHKVEDGYVISSEGVWRPGCYADERTANYAFRFTDEQLQTAQDAVSPGVVTLEQLQAIRAGGDA